MAQKLRFLACLAMALLLLWLGGRERERLADARERLETARERLGAALAQLATQRAALDLARVEGAQQPQVPVTGTAPVAAARSRAPRRPLAVQLLAQHPQLHGLYLEAYRRELEFTYAFSFAKRGFSEEQRVRAVAVLARDWERYSDIMVAMHARGLSWADEAAIEKLLRERRQTLQAELYAKLGVRDIALPEQTWIPPAYSDVISALHRTPWALDVEQARALFALLTDQRDGVRLRFGSRLVADKSTPLTRADYEAVVTQSGAFLATEQRAVLRTELERMWAAQILDRALPKRR
ncbi:MAG: hypothetical protein V4773_07145 [Verrucomicrobiota bacterium]